MLFGRDGDVILWLERVFNRNGEEALLCNILDDKSTRGIREAPLFAGVSMGYDGI